jgi:hypothetical protein
MHSPGALPANFTPAEHANFLAGKAVSYATGYLDGRHDASQLARHARALQIELLAAPDDPAARAILDPVRMLMVAMTCTSWAFGEARQDRWQHVMGSLVELVRHESIELRVAATPTVDDVPSCGQENDYRRRSSAFGPDPEWTARGAEGVTDRVRRSPEGEAR